MFKYIIITTSFVASSLAFAQTEPDLPISLANISGKWSCESTFIDKANTGIRIFGKYNTTISKNGMEKSPEMIMAVFTKDMTEADASVYHFKGNVIALNTLDNDQLSSQVVSGNITSVKHVSGFEVMPLSEIKKQTQKELIKEIREKIKNKIHTSMLTSKEWRFSIDDPELNMSYVCLKN